MRSFNLLALLSVFAASASAADFNGIMRTHLKERQLADPSAEDILCLTSSIELLTGSLSAVMETFGNLTAVCPNGVGDCDLSTTDLAAGLKAQCTENGGKIFDENISMCRSTIDDLKAAIPNILAAATAGEEEMTAEETQDAVNMVNALLDSIEEVSITGIPVCLSSECPDDLDLFSLIASFVDQAIASVSSSMGDDEKAIVQVVAALMTDVLEGEDCSTNNNSDGNNSNGSTASSSSVIGKFAPVAVALGAALFAL